MSGLVTLDRLRDQVARVVVEVPEDELPTLARLLVQAGADCEVRLRAAMARRPSPPAADSDQMLTVKEAARLAGMSASWVKNMVASGRLRAIRMPGTSTGRDVVHTREGRAVRIRRGDLLAFIAAAERDAA